MARSTRKMTAPMSMYTKITEGPAMEMARPEPMNRPVPMAPPIAMSWMWRLLRPRCSRSPCSGALGFRLTLFCSVTTSSFQRLYPVPHVPLLE